LKAGEVVAIRASLPPGMDQRLIEESPGSPMARLAG